MMSFQARQMGLMWMSGSSRLFVSWCQGRVSDSLPEYALLLTGINYTVSSLVTKQGREAHALVPM
jgi:hypothetical protein